MDVTAGREVVVVGGGLAGLTAAYRLAFARPPDPDELATAIAFLHQGQLESAENQTISETAIVDFCHVLLCSNELMFVD